MFWRALAGDEDLVVRPARSMDAPALARVQVDSWRESYRGILPDPHLDGLDVHAHERQWRRSLGGRGWAFAAICDGQMAGIVSGGPARSRKVHDGEIYVLYLLRSFQGRGIGRGLFDAAQLELTRRGFRHTIVRVLADNPARGFYEHLGGVEVGRFTSVIAGRRFEEVAYGWLD